MQNCGCNSGPVLSWYDLINAAPKNPFNVIAYADMDGTPGTFEYSDIFLNIGGGWVDTPIGVGADGVCKAWETDNIQKVGDALMWSQQHQVTNNASDLAPPLQKMMFLRGGTAWKMEIPLSFGVDIGILELSFLDNAGTRGDSQGTIPVLHFEAPGGTWTSGNHLLTVTLKRFGAFSMGLKSEAISGDHAMMEMDWVVVR